MLYIVGPLPPPYGGISNHISRLEPFLQQSNISYKVINQFRGSKFLLVIKVIAVLILKRNIHVHLFSTYLLLLLFVITNLLPHKRIILSIHNDRLIGKRLYHFLVTRSKLYKLISVSKRSRKYWALRCRFPVVSLSAFVPQAKYEVRDCRTPRVVANVWSHYQGVVEDYGLDCFVRFARALPSTEFVLYVGNEQSEIFFVSTLPRLDNLTLKFGFNLSAEFSENDTFVRLNRVDAFGVSLVEAMGAGVPALATNVCRRPAGCLVFSDYDELFDKLVEVIDSDKASRALYLDGFVEPSDHRELIQIYREQCTK